MCPEAYDPNWKPPTREEFGADRTDLKSLMTTQALIESSVAPPPSKQPERTDFQSIKGEIGQVRPTQFRTWTDWLLDGVTPCMIYLMVASVVFFLLDVRYVYTEVGHYYLRMVAFFFLMGVVALNRLVARDGSEESLLYIGFFGGVVVMYTFTSPDLYPRDGSKGGLLEDPASFAGFNFVVMAFLWWLVNRLTHECCVDENLAAGNIGILTGTARKFQRALRRDPTLSENRKKKADPVLMPMMELEPFDPREGYRTKQSPETPAQGSLSDRLAKRHPGMSVFYFSVPVMFIFAAGLPVVRQGGAEMVFRGQCYMIAYTVSALMLLMLTSLGGLRAHFRVRKIRIPGTIGWFWIGLGTVMVAFVVVGALQLPMPELPAMARVTEHQTDFWTRDSTFQLADPDAAAEPGAILRQSRFTRVVGRGVLAVFTVFLGYAALKGLAAFAAAVGRRRDRFPRFVVRFFNALDALLTRLTRLPTLPKRHRRVRVQRSIATSTAFRNSLGDAIRAGMPIEQHVEYAYSALCALALDVGVPRRVDQTPSEFIAAFPAALNVLRPHAEELTRLYELAAYSPIPMEERTADRLRKFWIAYNQVRNHIVR